MTSLLPLRVAALALACVAVPAVAAPVTYTFEGVVDWDDAERGWAAFEGTFSFDSQAVDTIADPSTAAYAHIGAPWGMSVSFDGSVTAALSDGFHVLVSNDLGGSDQFGALAQDAAQSQALTLTLWDFTQSLFASDALPLPAGGLQLADFGWSGFSYESAAGTLQGTLTQLSCTQGCEGVVVPPPAIPEPGSAWLLAVGLGAMRLARRRAPR
jgi:hypothetical protein